MPISKDRSRIVTTTITTIFSTTIEMARSVCQRFMDALSVERTIKTPSDIGMYPITVSERRGTASTQNPWDLCDPTMKDAYCKRMVIDLQLCILEVLDTAGQGEYASLWQGGRLTLKEWWICARYCLSSSRDKATGLQRLPLYLHLVRGTGLPLIKCRGGVAESNDIVRGRKVSCIYTQQCTILKYRANDSLLAMICDSIPNTNPTSLATLLLIIPIPEVTLISSYSY